MQDRVFQYYQVNGSHLGLAGDGWKYFNNGAAEKLMQSKLILSCSLKTEIWAKAKLPSQFVLSVMHVSGVSSETEACVDKETQVSQNYLCVLVGAYIGEGSLCWSSGRLTGLIARAVASAKH